MARSKFIFRIEIAFYCVFIITACYLLISSDAYEAFHEFSRNHEDWELDELILVMPVLLIALFVFVIHRLKDLRVTASELKAKNTELQKANEHIRELSTAREQFVSIAYHDLVNSISGVTNALTLMELSESNEELQENLMQARVLSEGLRQYSSDILTVTRHISNGRLGAPVQMDIRKTIGQAVSTAEYKSRQIGVETTTEFSSDLPQMIWGYPELLRHVVQNLTDNSVKHTQKGSIRVYCGMLQTKEPTLLLSITDTGPGISDTMRETVFKPYKQGDQEHGGVGLGLYIVKRIVDLLGGSISVRPNEPQGSIFEVKVALDSEPKQKTGKPE